MAKQKHSEAIKIPSTLYEYRGGRTDRHALRSTGIQWIAELPSGSIAEVVLPAGWKRTRTEEPDRYVVVDDRGITRLILDYSPVTKHNGTYIVDVGKALADDLAADDNVTPGQRMWHMFDRDERIACKNRLRVHASDSDTGRKKRAKHWLSQLS